LTRCARPPTTLQLLYDIILRRDQHALLLLGNRLRVYYRRFFGDDTVLFGETLRTTGGVVSGSVVLHLLLFPIDWQVNDIDIVLPLDHLRPYNVGAPPSPGPLC